MHEIEGLIEDSVHLVANSNFTATNKRDFLYNLYDFQCRFDTGYTHFRLIDTLLELKFTYRVPLEEHPDYEKHTDYFQSLDVKKTYWLPSEIGKEHDSVYAREEKGVIFLYADAGTTFWRRLCEKNVLPEKESTAPSTFKVSCLIWKLLAEAKRQNSKPLLQDWYALLVNLVGYDLGPKEGFPDAFLEFIEQKEVNEIRRIGKNSELFSNPDVNNDWGQLATPVLSEIAEEEHRTERLFCIKWLLDFETDEQTLRRAYTEAVRPDPLRNQKLQLVPEAVEWHLGAKTWKLVWNESYEYGHKWLYYHQFRGETGIALDTDLHVYLLLEANTEDLKILYPKIGVQMGKLNRWQGRTAVHKPECVHFFETLTSVMPEKENDTNKSLGYFGGWKLNLKNSEKTLKKHIDNFFECFKKHGHKLLAEFEKPLFNNFEMSLQEALAYREDMQYTHRFFLNEIEVYLVYAIHEWELNNVERAKELAREAMKRVENKKHPVKEAWMATAQSVLNDCPVLNELLSFDRSYFDQK